MRDTELFFSYAFFIDIIILSEICEYILDFNASFCPSDIQCSLFYYNHCVSRLTAKIEIERVNGEMQCGRKVCVSNGAVHKRPPVA